MLYPLLLRLLASTFYTNDFALFHSSRQPKRHIAASTAQNEDVFAIQWLQIRLEPLQHGG